MAFLQDLAHHGRNFSGILTLTVSAIVWHFLLPLIAKLLISARVLATWERTST